MGQSPGDRVPHKTIVTIADRPDLVPVVARWLWDAFWRRWGYDLDHVTALVAGSTARIGPPQAFVLLVDGEPVGTASLVVSDLDQRPDLTPWLAGVYVAPEARGGGYAYDLVHAVEDAARAAAIPTLWLYTSRAEGLYRKIGWETVDSFDRNGELVPIMRRQLG
jgi:GNAT superfamily N-acetyltransferase